MHGDKNLATWAIAALRAHILFVQAQLLMICHIDWNSHSVLGLNLFMFHYIILTFDYNAQRTRLILSILIHIRSHLLIKFPFKRKGLSSSSASLHVKVKKYTCASDFPTPPRIFVQTLNMIKHFIVNLRKTIVN